MKHQGILYIFLLAINFSSCGHHAEKVAQTPVPVRFDREWKHIQSSKSKAEEEIAVSKFLDAVYNEKRFDSTGISYGIYYSCEDINNNRRRLSALFEKNAEDSLKTIIIEIAPLVNHTIMKKQIYKDWKPKDLRVLRYFMDR